MNLLKSATLMTCLFTAGGALAEPEAASKNPLLARFGEKKIHLMDVQNRKKQFKELENAPLDAVIDGLVQQMVAEALIEAEVKKSNLDNDPEVMEKAKRCTEMAKMQTFVERQIAKTIKPEEMRELFNELVKDFKSQKEIRAAHILVKTDAEAKDVIKSLDSGKSFEEVAKEKSADPTTKDKGGDLGFFPKALATETLGSEFAEAAFILKEGHHSKKPVKTQLGYHILKVGKSRHSSPPKFEDVEPQLKLIKAQEGLLKYIDKLFSEAKGLELYDLKGNKVEPKKIAEAAKAAQLQKKKGPAPVPAA